MVSALGLSPSNPAGCLIMNNSEPVDEDEPITGCCCCRNLMNSDTFTGKLLLSAEGGVSRMQCNSLLGGLNGIYTGVGKKLESGHRG